MARGRRLVEALAAAASRYAPEDRERKRALLADLEGVAVRDAGTLLRLHEALCFLQAYPDNAKMLEHVDRALERFGARVHRLGTAARPRLHDSGVTHTILDYPFGFPMARWLAARFPRESDVAWPAFADADRLDETLSLLATAAEGDAFSEGGSAGGSGFASPRAAAEVFLMLPGSSPAPDRRLRATGVSALVARYVAREFSGDRARATRDSVDRVARMLGVRRRAAWPSAERRAFERLSLVAALVPDLSAWSLAERRALLSVMRAKGSGSEMAYARRLDGHRRLRRSLEALARA